MIGIPKNTNLHTHARALEFDWLIQKRLQIIYYQVKWVDIHSISRLYNDLYIETTKNGNMHARARAFDMIGSYWNVDEWQIKSWNKLIFTT